MNKEKNNKEKNNKEKVVIFSGTTEGHLISERLSEAGRQHIVCVASEYARQTQKSAFAVMHTGRMDKDEMAYFLSSEGFGKGDLVIDATHPYAVIASENIKATANRLKCLYIRVERGCKYFKTERNRQVMRNKEIEDNTIMDRAEKPELDSMEGTYERALKHEGKQCDPEYSKYPEYESIKDIAQYLNESTGNILLTTGSKELADYCMNVSDETKARTFVRVIPSAESITKCNKAGIRPDHIIAMHGPFSYEINYALIRQYDIRHLVTKDSGKTGGFEEKLRAAADAKAAVHVIRRPDNANSGGISAEEALDIILRQDCFGENTKESLEVQTMEQSFDWTMEPSDDQMMEQLHDRTTGSSDDQALVHSYDKALEPSNKKRTSDKNDDRYDIRVTLAGMGMGNAGTMTTDVKQAIDEADVIFGAKRLTKVLTTETVSPEKVSPVITVMEISSQDEAPAKSDAAESYAAESHAAENHVEDRVVTGAKDIYPFYRAEDIIPVLESGGYKRAVVLFSGDSGFYSGAKAMTEKLSAWRKDIGIDVLPGISSVACLAAKLKTSYDDAAVFSLHGKNTDYDLCRLTGLVRHNRKTFVLLSGAKDLKKIMEGLKRWDTSAVIFAGFSLSYDNERIERFVCGRNADAYDTMPHHDEKELKYGIDVKAENAVKDVTGVKNVKDVIDININSVECEKIPDVNGPVTIMIINEEPEKQPLINVKKDEDFIRGNVPMTKEVIRHESIIRLELREGDVLYDIGGGTGSVAIEAASLDPGLLVYTFEKDPEAIDLIRQNMEKNDAGNVQIVEGDALDVLMNAKGSVELPKPDGVFIGGSTGELPQIIDILTRCYCKKTGGKQTDPDLTRMIQCSPLKSEGIRFVINAVSLETISEIQEILEKYDVKDESIVQIAVNEIHKAGTHSMLRAQNPVFICSFTL